MSAYEVSLDHIGVLVNLGSELRIRALWHAESVRHLDLDDEKDRSAVARALIAQNHTSVLHREGVGGDAPVSVPPFRRIPVPVASLADLAQALQWVGCYRYQSCEDPGWRSSFASSYTDRLTAELVRRVIGAFPTTWDYEGPALACPTLGTLR